MPLQNRSKIFKDLLPGERKTLVRLSTPAKIQDYLDSLPMNFSDADPCLCPRQVLKQHTAHCMEGALFAAAALWFHGHKPLLLDLTTTHDDEDHVVALFQMPVQGRGRVAGRGRGKSSDFAWGAISKTNHAVLRYREPIYKSVRELAMSYFHEYFLNGGPHAAQKTLRTFSTRPFNLSASRYSKLNWVTSQDGIMEIIDVMANAPHTKILTVQQTKNLRKADQIEIRAGKIVEWPRRRS